MIKAVIFDFDHTLYDRDATYDKMVPGVCRDLDAYINKSLPYEEILKRMKQADKDGAYPHGWPAVYEEKVAHDVFSVAPDYKTYMKAIRTHHPISITLFDDTLSTLTSLREKGFKLGMLTNGGKQSQRDKLQNTPLAPYFDKILIGGDLPEEKPHASAYHAICEALDVAPAEAIYVGDHPYNDVQGSKNAGLVSVWIPYVKPFPADATPPDFTIERLSDLLPLVDKLNKA
jgi:putative hydrolase of the HAD superfamily